MYSREYVGTIPRHVLNDRMKELEKLIGYSFQSKNKWFLERATNSEKLGSSERSHRNDPWAVLGDALLDFIFGLECIKVNEKASFLENMRQKLANNDYFREKIKDSGLLNFVHNNNGFYDQKYVGASGNPVDTQVYVSHDSCIEAIAYAIYLDGGMNTCIRWAREFFKVELKEMCKEGNSAK